MHVLYIIGQDSGGMPHYAMQLANAVVDYADVTVMKPTTTTADGLFDDRIEVLEPFSPIDISVPRLYRRDINPVNTARGVLSYRHLKQIRELDVDVVHDPTGLFPQVKLFTKYYGLDSAVPFVVTRHEVEQNRLSPSQPQHILETMMDLAIPDLNEAGTIVHTEFQKRVLVDRGHAPESVAVIPHGAYSMFGTHAGLVREPEENCVLFFGNVGPHKGVHTLIEAVPYLKEQLQDVTVVIAGDGKIPEEVRPILETHSECFEIHDRFIPNEEVQAFFERAQVVALPYPDRKGDTNGHSGVLSVAFSFGTPVVSSESGDFRTLVGEEETGIVVPAENPKRLAAALTEVLSDGERRRTFAANSRRMARELSWGTIGRRHVDLYETVLNGTRDDGEHATSRRLSRSYQSRFV